jgi:tetratricopeptide (TPR) repeat protein
VSEFLRFFIFGGTPVLNYSDDQRSINYGNAGMNSLLKFIVAVAALSGFLGTTPATANNELPPECGNLYDFRFHAGPWDYRRLTKDQKDVVEFAHFSPAVESLRKGITGPIGGDLDYTLRVIPNHHRALASMIRLAERERTTKPEGARYTVECYFHRARQMAPDDIQISMLYGVALLRAGQTKNAVEELEKARAVDDQSASIHYNLGLAYFDLKDFEKSLTHAKRAYDNGYPLKALREKLQRAGKWKD